MSKKKVISEWPQKFWRPTRNGEPYPIMPCVMYPPSNLSGCAGQPIVGLVSYVEGNERHIACMSVWTQGAPSFCGGNLLTYFYLQHMPQEGAKAWSTNVPCLDNWMGKDWMEQVTRAGLFVAPPRYTHQLNNQRNYANAILRESLFWTYMLIANQRNQNITNFWDYERGQTERHVKESFRKNHYITCDTMSIIRWQSDAMATAPREPMFHPGYYGVRMDYLSRAARTRNRNSGSMVSPYVLKTSVVDTEHTTSTSKTHIHLAGDTKAVWERLYDFRQGGSIAKCLRECGIVG